MMDNEYFKKTTLTSLVMSLFVSVNALAAEQTGGEKTVELGEVTVTATREAQSVHESTHSVGQVNEQTIAETRPAHPAEIMGQVPGVHVNVTGGEGHMTAIRQPITTSPVYLYLEDGIPTRSTGFFNHNALYEINLPQSGGVEVLKGPGSALYGSDAIGGVVNVETRPAPLTAEVDTTFEYGDHGWERLLLSAGNTLGNDGVRSSANITHTDGWRKGTEYDRYSYNLRWDRNLESGATLKTVISRSSINQNTAGSSRLSEADYLNNPTENYTPISYRKVEATRLSVAYEKETADTLTSVVPYYRSNSMELMPNWSFSFDPSIWDTQNQSFGVMLKHRMDFKPMRTRVVVGADIDYSPGSRVDYSIDATQTGNIYDDYTVTTKLYDYDVAFTGVSPYVHSEFSPSDNIRITAGLRYDDLSYDYDDNMDVASVSVTPSSAFPLTYNHVADTTVDFSRLSPKLGMTYQFNSQHSGFIAYREAFRAPSEGQLFRPGRAVDTENLKPVKVKSIETGLRGKAGPVKYNLSVYSMRKLDDIVSYRDPVTNERLSVNAGETLHEGVELGIGTNLAENVTLDIAASNASHTYEDWVVLVGGGNVDYSGNDMSAAPELVMNVRLGFRPVFMNQGKIELEWEKLGEYWMDDANTEKYAGHDLLNLRVNYPASKHLELFARVMNLTDERYATNSAVSSGNRQFAPGAPRTAYAGINYQF